MNTEEVWAEITSGFKWWAGLRTSSGSFHSPQSANRLKHRFKEGTLSMKLIADIFSQCGYARSPDTWTKEKKEWVKKIG